MKRKSVLTALTVSAILILAMASGCALMAQVKQDKPFAPDQCFEGKFNVHRLISEKWEPVYRRGQMFFLKNPNRGYPIIVAVLLHPMNGLVVRYAYLDGKHVVAYKIHMMKNLKICYIADTLDEKERNYLENKIQVLSKEALATK